MLNRPRPVSEQAWPADATPRLSVCCTTYNHAPFIRDCLDGFLIQETTFPIEILVHDDASTDGTEEIVHDYVERFPDLIRPIFQTENQYSKGCMPDVQFNFPRARGEYIAVCEGDDYWTDPAKLETQVSFLAANPDYVLCYHNARIVDAQGKTVVESQLAASEQRDYRPEELLKGAWVPSLTRCFRNVLTEFPEELGKVLNLDLFLVVLLGRYGGAKYLADILPAVYRRQPTSIYSSLPPDEQALASFNSRVYIYQYLARAVDKGIALEFLLESLMEFAQRLEPARNPLCLELAKKERVIRALESRVREAASSPGYRAWRAATWPIRKLRQLALAPFPRD